MIISSARSRVIVPGGAISINSSPDRSARSSSVLMSFSPSATTTAGLRPSTFASSSETPSSSRRREKDTSALSQFRSEVFVESLDLGQILQRHERHLLHVRKPFGDKKMRNH